MRYLPIALIPNPPKMAFEGNEYLKTKGWEFLSTFPTWVALDQIQLIKDICGPSDIIIKYEEIRVNPEDPSSGVGHIAFLISPWASYLFELYIFGKNH